MKTDIILAIYLIGFLLWYLQMRKEAIADKIWIIKNFILILMSSIIWPIIAPFYFLHLILKNKFWNKDLPKWF